MIKSLLTTRSPEKLQLKLLIDKMGQACTIALAFAIPVSTALTSVFGLLTVICWLLSGHGQEKWQIVVHHPLMKWFYLIIALALIGVSYSIGSSEAIRNGIIDALRLGTIPILLYYYRSEKIATYALWAFVGAMVLTLMLGYLKVYAHLPIGLKYTSGAVFKNHIKTSYFMAMAAFFLSLKVKALPQYRTPLIVIISLMIHYLLFMSIGRIGYIAIVICLGVLAWQSYRLKGLMGAVLIAVALITTTYFTSPLFQQRINLLSQDLDFYEKGDLINSSLGSRIAFAKGSLAIMAQSPWIGSGTGSFRQVYENQHAGIDTLLTTNPHNEYLRMGVEFGLLGIGLLLLLFFKQWQYMRFMTPDKRQLWQGVLLTFMVGCFINSWLMDFAECYFFCVMTAICFATPPHPPSDLTRRFAPPSPKGEGK